MKTRNGQPPGFWSGTFVGMVIGMASLLLYQFLSGLLREPRLIPYIFLSDEKLFESKGALAMFIVAENLRSGIQVRFLKRGVGKKILHAGYRNFRESWARDFGFATYGLLGIGENETVHDTLESFFWHQTSDGQLPVKLHSMHFAARFLHSLLGREQPTEKILKPKYISAHGAPSLDGQGLLIIAALYYAKETGDDNFLKRYWSQLTLAVKWLQNHRKDADDLLHQQAYADWVDSIARQGCVLYTNVIYWKALTEMAHSAATLDRKEESDRYGEEAERVLRTINERLWHPELGYFVTSESLKNLSSDGNLLAVMWGLALPEQAQSILDVMQAKKMAEPVPTRVVYPSYPSRLIALENRLGGLSNYHTDSSWLWIGACHVIALTRSGDMEQARHVLERIVDVIVKERQVHEVHGPDGEPLSSFWYKTEAPLTWNAGMVLYAYDVYEKQSNPNLNILPLIEKITE